MLLRAHTLGVAGVLFEDTPTGSDNEAAVAKKKWARDDAICRGHILATLSDRLLPDYARHATARALWDALARTYDVDTTWISKGRFNELQFDQGEPHLLLEQIAHAQALGAAAKLADDYVTDVMCDKLPEAMGTALIITRYDDEVDMDTVWAFARRAAKMGMSQERLWRTTL
ncbi:hypothetical protein PR202_ga20976 [Eleusine coracana subsp. coracana]|uniref:Uncharacterized protein n=1 Tax=Eleusine coracana subsp. coracana TaxID=191504 RepID=A0AAV5CZC7_ELECO|nr:hypothetical protein PR202_ga20976 [Eleusine coracana subsp. coracana]